MVVAPVLVFLTLNLEGKCGIRREAFVESLAEGRQVTRVEGPVLLSSSGVVPCEDGELILLHDAAELGLDLFNKASGLLIRHPIGLSRIGPSDVDTHTELAALDELRQALADGQEDNSSFFGMAHAGEPVIGKYHIIYVGRFSPKGTQSPPCTFHPSPDEAP